MIDHAMLVALAYGLKQYMSSGAYADNFDSKELADIVVFASPSYFAHISGQLKTAADRLYAMFNSLPESEFKKQSVLLMTAVAPYFEGAVFWYNVFSHMGWGKF